DAAIAITEQPGTQYLVGGVDEISSYNYNIDYLAGWYDKTKSNEGLYNSNTPRTIAGEGACMFLVNDAAAGSLARLEAIEAFQSSDKQQVETRFRQFLDAYAPDINHTLFISGENGDSRFLPGYATCEFAIGSSIPVARFKHLSGEYPTASSFALWLACQALKEQGLPAHVYKNEHNLTQIDRVIIYNQYQGIQHSLLLVSR